MLYDTELELEGNIIVFTTESSAFEITETALGLKRLLSPPKSLVQSSDAEF